MSLWHMAWRYLWGRALVTTLTLTGIALSAALIWHGVFPGPMLRLIGVAARF